LELWTELARENVKACVSWLEMVEKVSTERRAVLSSGVARGIQGVNLPEGLAVSEKETGAYEDTFLASFAYSRDRSYQ
jgi:hypothetical protein